MTALVTAQKKSATHRCTRERATTRTSTVQHVHIHSFISIQCNSIQFISFQFNSIPFNIQFNSIQFNSIQFNSIHSIQFNSIQFNSIQVSHSRTHGTCTHSEARVTAHTVVAFSSSNVLETFFTCSSSARSSLSSSCSLRLTFWSTGAHRLTFCDVTWCFARVLEISAEYLTRWCLGNVPRTP